MVSIVVCSRNPTRFKAFSDSIVETVGVPYEVVKIDNEKNEYSLCSAYNKGITLAKYDLICFSHEDIVFNSRDWGLKLNEALVDPSVGLVGVMGVCFYNLHPFSWIDQKELEGQVIVGALPDSPTHYHVRFPSRGTAEVAAVDGMFMATRKNVVAEFRFSEDILTDFHGYDIDFNLQIRTKYKIVVSRDILLFHASGGVYNAAYYNALSVLAAKWKKSFPIYISAYSKKEIKKVHLKSLRQFWEVKKQQGLKVTHFIYLIKSAWQGKIIPPFFSAFSRSEWSKKKAKHE